MPSSHLQKENDRKSESSLNTIYQEPATKSNAIEIPSISLPKGGGAIKGIDEIFGTNLA